MNDGVADAEATELGLREQIADLIHARSRVHEVRQLLAQAALGRLGVGERLAHRPPALLG